MAAKGDTKATVVSHDGLRFDLRVVPPESYGNLLQHFTGSKEHNVALREAAVRRGLSVSEYGVTKVETGEVFTTARRGGAVRASRLRLHPAGAARERAASSRRRASGELPELVELGDLRGDLHAHTTWSATARTRSRRWRAPRSERGYEYLAVCDHSHYLRDERLAAAVGGDRRAERARSRRSGSCAASR